MDNDKTYLPFVEVTPMYFFPVEEVTEYNEEDVTA